MDSGTLTSSQHMRYCAMQVLKGVTRGRYENLADNLVETAKRNLQELTTAARSTIPFV